MARTLVRNLVGIRSATGEVILAEDALVTVREPGTATTIPAFAAEAGGSALTQPLRSTSAGEIQVWIDAQDTPSVDLFVSSDALTKRAGTVSLLSFPPFTEPVSLGGVPDLSEPSIQGGVGFKPNLAQAWWDDLLASIGAAAPADVVVIGDSIAAQGTVGAPAWPWLLNTALAYRSGRTGPQGAVFPDGGASVPAVTTPGGTSSAAGMGGWARSLAAGQSLENVFASIDGVSIVYTGGGGTLTVRDGGSGGTIIGTIAPGAPGASQVWTSGALSLGAHTIHVASSGGTTVVEALYGHSGNRASGVRVWPCVHHGYTSADFTANTNRGLDLISTLEAAGSLALVIVATSTNDDVGAGGPTYTALLDAIAARTAAPVVAWIPYTSTAFSRAEASAVRATVEARGLPAVDADRLDPRFGPTKTGDGTHPIQSYQQLLADQVFSVVGGDPMGQALKDVPRLGTAATQAAPGDIVAARKTIWSVLEEDFLGAALPAAWTATNATGGTNQALTLTTIDHPGGWRVTATTTTGSSATLSRLLNSYVDTTWRASFWFKAGFTGSTPLYRIGMFTVDGAGASVLGVWLEKTNGQTVWRLASQAFLGAVTYQALLAPPTLDTAWHSVDFYRVGSTMLVLMDGVLQATLGSIPNMGSPAFQAHDAGSSGQGYIDMDRVEFAITGLAR